MNEDILVSLKNVSFKYNDEPVLENISMDIKRGEFMGLIGPNGSGKTTLLKIIVGLLSQTSGELKLFGTNSKSFKEKWRIGYVPQRAGLSIFNFPITVQEIVSLGLVNAKNITHDAVRDALNAVEMHKFRSRLINELSGGQQQRVFIARSLVKNPELLLLDEPTVGVDSQAQKSFYELLRHLNRERNLTLILVSHDIDVVSKEVNTIACINRTLLGHVSSSEFKKEHLVEKMYGENLLKITHKH